LATVLDGMIASYLATAFTNLSAETRKNYEKFVIKSCQLDVIRTQDMLQSLILAQVYQ